MKSNHQEQPGQKAEENGHPEVDHVEPNNTHNEDSSDGTSHHGSVGGASTEEDPIVTPAAVAAAAQSQNTKRPLSKQPSNGIHVLKPEGLAPTTNGLPPSYPTADVPAQANGDAANSRIKEEDITFDPNGSYYMANACCELIHYRTAAILVGMAELALIAAWGSLIGYYYTKSGGIDDVGSKASIGVQAFVAAIFLAVIILMLVGVMAERPFLLWPHMIVQIGGISLGIAFTVVAVVAMCVGTYWAESIFSHIYGAENLPWVEKSLGPIWPFCLAVVFDFGAALGIWFYIVIKGCYEYLMDKAFFEKEINGAHNLSLKKENLDASTKKPS